MHRQVIVYLSDLHLGKYWKTDHKRARKIILNLKNNLENIHKDLSSKYDEILLVLCGDTYDTAQAITELLIFIREHLFDVFLKFNKLYVIGGNHDSLIDYYGEQRCLADAALLLHNTVVISKNISNFNICNYNHIFLPSQQNVTEKLSLVKSLLSKECNNIIISHFTPNEFMHFNKFEVSPIITSFLNEGFKIPYMFLGDYHIPLEKQIKSTNSNNSCTLFSVGSTYYSNIDDIRNDSHKRIILLDENGIRERKLDLPKIKHIDINSEEDKQLFESSTLVSGDNVYHIRVNSNDIDLYEIIKKYDVYLEKIIKKKFTMLNEEINSEEIITDLSDPMECWNSYIGTLRIDQKLKDVATSIFEKRMAIRNENDLVSLMNGDDL